MSDSAELAALIAEQEKDDRWGHLVDGRGPSLDFSFEGGGTFGEIVGYQTSAGESGTRLVRHPGKWTKREIITAIRQWAREHGQPPLNKEWKRPNGRGIPSTSSVVRTFGSWSAAIAAAGFVPRPVGGTTQPVSGTRLRPRIRTQKRTAHLTPEQIAAAYVLYDRQQLSMPELAEKLWQPYGYQSPNACRTALLRAFHADGFRVRTHGEAGRLWGARRSG